MADKPGMEIILGLGKKKPGMGGGMGGMGDDMGGMDVKAEDDAISAMIDGIKSGDAAAAKDGLKTFLELCYPSLKHGDDYEEDGGNEE